MIRRLKILIAHKEVKLRRAPSHNSREKIRLELKSLQVALCIAIQNRNDRRGAA